MELALNLLWLACALALSFSLGWRLAHRDRRSSGSLAPWQSVVTLACTLVILFPVISMTDDLHDEQFVIEDARPLRGALQMRSASASSTHTGGSELWLATLAAAPSCALIRLMVSRVEEFVPAPAMPGESQPSIGRAPPRSPA